MEKQFKYRIALISAALLFIFSGTSCVKDEKMKIEKEGNALSISPSIFDDGVDYLKGRTKKAVTKAKDDTDTGIQKGDDVNARAELQETLIETLDIFIKKESDPETTSWVKEYHLTKDDEEAILNPEVPGGLLEKAKHVLSQSWPKEGFEEGVDYHIYVTANNPHTANTSSDKPSNLAQLKALTTYDLTIFRIYAENPTEDDVRYYNKVGQKLFIMDGDMIWRLKPEEGEQVFDVDLRRAASKIIVNMEMSNTPMQYEIDGEMEEMTFKQYLAKMHLVPGTPRFKYVNFGFRTADIADGTFEIDTDNHGDELDPDADLKTASGNFTCIGEDNPWNYKVTTYSYPFKWKGYSDTPYLLVSIRYTYWNDDDPDDPKNNTYTINYYHIPVCDEAENFETGLERNNIYIVDASIASMGSENEDIEADEFPVRIEYHVVPWTATNMEQEATVIKLSDITYLNVYPTTYTLKGDDIKSVKLNWYASVSPDDPRYVDIDLSSVKVSFENYLGKEIPITGTDQGINPASPGTENCIYKTAAPTGTNDFAIRSYAPERTGANGSHRESTEIHVSKDGMITVNSQALDSKAIKTISFRVKLNTTSLYKDVVIKHFPLDNIQSFTGYWSSKWNEASTTNPQTGNWVDWDRDFNQNVDRTTSQGIFTAKVFLDGTTYRITRGRNGRITQGTAEPDLGNNHMYVIQVTSTSTKYVLGRPTLDGNYQSQDRVVSPAFMIASQLGAVKRTTSGTTAATHCGTYMEVGTDGTRYVGWRLPTPGEIGVIINYQNGPYTAGVTMSVVLGGRYYWTLNGSTALVESGDQGTETNAYVRCVRDLTVAEVEQLNNR